MLQIVLTPPLLSQEFGICAFHCFFKLLFRFDVLHKRYCDEVLYVVRLVSQSPIKIIDDFSSLAGVRKNKSQNLSHEYVRKNLVVVCEMFLQNALQTSILIAKFSTK